jgi:hypothetical protein
VEKLFDISGLAVRIKGRLLRIARPEGDAYRALDPESAIKKLRSSTRRIDLFTFMQPLSLALATVLTVASLPCLVDWDDWAVVPVSTFDAWWTDQVDKTVRTKVRKSEKSGISVRRISLDEGVVQGVCEIYNELPIRQGRPYPHYGQDAQAVHAELATFSDSSIFLGAFLHDELVGFMKLTADEAGTQLRTMSLATMARHKDKAVMNALIAHAVKISADLNIPYLIYGSFSYGKKVPDSLSAFKRDNGFLRVDLPRYYVPLTLVGNAALRLGLHHDLSSHLPEPLFAKLRDFRNAYYNHKLRAWTEAEEAKVQDCTGAQSPTFRGAADATAKYSRIT